MKPCKQKKLDELNKVRDFVLSCEDRYSFDSWRVEKITDLTDISFSSLKGDKNGELIVPRYFTGGDYANSSSVEYSNFLIFQEIMETCRKCGYHPSNQNHHAKNTCDHFTYLGRYMWEVSGDYGSYGIAIHVSLPDIDIWQNIESLYKYPVLDEDKMSEIEREWTEENWESWVKSDFRDALIKKFEDSWDTHTNSCEWWERHYSTNWKREREVVEDEYRPYAQERDSKLDAMTINERLDFYKEEDAKGVHKKIVDEYYAKHAAITAKVEKWMEENPNPCKHAKGKCFIFEDFMDTVSDDLLRNFFENMAEKANVNWENEGHGSMHIRVKDVVNSITSAHIHGFIREVENENV
jgi:hypothetical protein